MEFLAQRYEPDQPTDGLTPFPGNPRIHDDARLDASLAANGFAGAVIADERTGFILAGHGRVERVEAAGQGTVPTIWVTSEDDQHATRLLLALNPPPDDPGFHAPALADLLTSLAEEGDGDLSGAGYTAADLDLLLAELSDDAATDPTEEWVGMPEFEQHDREPKYRTTVNFLNQEDAARFAREVLGEDKAKRYAWWPSHDGFEGSSYEQAYVAAEDG